MAEPAKESDQSMEDILQSIKRIIADEGDSAPTSGGSDVLELTELLAEDAAPPAAFEPAHEPAAPQPAAHVSAQDDIDALFNMPAVAPAPVQPALVTAPVAAAAPTAPAVTVHAVSEHGAGLMSDVTLAASVAALNALAHKPEPLAAMRTSHVLRSGVTIEDLVVESLKPMLKEWLDGNLPELVRTLVEREIRRVSGH